MEFSFSYRTHARPNGDGRWYLPSRLPMPNQETLFGGALRLVIMVGIDKKKSPLWWLLGFFTFRVPCCCCFVLGCSLSPWGVSPIDLLDVLSVSFPILPKCATYRAHLNLGFISHYHWLKKDMSNPKYIKVMHKVPLFHLVSQLSVVTAK